MKNSLIVVVAIILSSSSVFAQSKKQQIKALEEKLETANQEIADYKLEFDKTRDLILSYDDFKREFERSMTTLMNENESFREVNLYYEDQILALQGKVKELEAKKGK